MKIPRDRYPDHRVQFYGADNGALIRNVGSYLAEGLRAGGGAIAIAIPAHRTAFLAEIAREGANPEAAVREGRLVLLDARETLSQLLDGDAPSAERFDHLAARIVPRLRERVGGGELRAYGEMVGLLWNAGRTAAAERLESLWNALVARETLCLYCGYEIDVFGSEFQAGVVDRILCAHSAVVPAVGGDRLAQAVSRAVDEVLGRRATDVKTLMKPKPQSSWPALPEGEAAVLWIRNHLPESAEEILRSARRFSGEQALRA